jgi:hypothetical protein
MKTGGTEGGNRLKSAISRAGYEFLANPASPVKHLFLSDVTTAHAANTSGSSSCGKDSLSVFRNTLMGIVTKTYFQNFSERIKTATFSGQYIEQDFTLDLSS